MTIAAKIIFTVALFLAYAFSLIVWMSSEVEAAEGDVWVSPYSHTRHYHYHGHIENGVYKKYQESHPSIGFEYEDKNSKSYDVGLYDDSCGNLALYAIRHWTYGYGAGAAIGVMIGESYPNWFIPFVGPEISASFNDARIQVGYVPAFGIKNAPNFLVAKISFKIN